MGYFRLNTRYIHHVDMLRIYRYVHGHMLMQRRGDDFQMYSVNQAGSTLLFRKDNLWQIFCLIFHIPPLKSFAYVLNCGLTTLFCLLMRIKTSNVQSRRKIILASIAFTLPPMPLNQLQCFIVMAGVLNMQIRFGYLCKAKVCVF